MLQIFSGLSFNYNVSTLLPISNEPNAVSQDDCPTLSPLKNRHIEITPKPLGFVLGEQARNLFTFFYSKLPTLSLPVAQASTIPTTCEAPKGSYLKTCTIKEAHSYRSSDPHLEDIKFCEYVIDCHLLKWGKIQTNRKVLAQEDTQCLAKMENCNGRLVLREGNDMLCQNGKVAEQYSEKTDQQEPPKGFWFG